MRRRWTVHLALWGAIAVAVPSAARETAPPERDEARMREAAPPQAVFDDEAIIAGWAARFEKRPKDFLKAMIADDTLDDYQMAAALRAFKDVYAREIFAREKRAAEKLLLRRLNRSDSAFVQVEAMHTLCRMDRYRYFHLMVPLLIQKLDHYNSAVNAMAYNALDDIIRTGNNRAREARIVFTTLRKVFFLSRRRLRDVTKPDERLSQKLDLLRWSVKVLGSQELRRLPKEVLNLL